MLKGPPDLGKTEIALQFASRVQRQFNRVLFINCAYEDVMRADLQSICTFLEGVKNVFFTRCITPPFILKF